jgi:hypothetical protein
VWREGNIQRGIKEGWRRGRRAEGEGVAWIEGDGGGGLFPITTEGGESR